jgi:hypothetical protein
MKKTIIAVIISVAMVFAGSNAFAQDANANATSGATAGVSNSGNGNVLGGANSSGSQAHAGASAAPVMNNTYNSQASDMSRGRAFAIPGSVVFPGTPGYFGEATPGHRFIPLAKLLMYNTVWDANAARNMLKGSTGHKDIEIRDLFATVETQPADKVYCSIASPMKLGATDVTQESIGTIAATNGKSISADVLAAAIVAAADRGCNYIQFMAEGVNREVDAHGWGIGFNTTQAQVYSGNNDKSNITSGGFGYSRGWAGYIDYPWMQFTFLSVKGLEGLPIAKALPAEGAEGSNGEVPQTSVRINPKS